MEYGNSFKGVLLAVEPQPLLTEFGINPILESCAGVLPQHKLKIDSFSPKFTLA